MNKYGFFGGAFNPPTFAHRDLAKDACFKFNLDKVFFVPVGNKYQKEGLIDEMHRFNMLKEIIYEEPRLDVLDIELNSNLEYKAIDIFRQIQKIYPNDELYFLMGGDNFEKISTWKEAENLVKNFKFIIFDRNIRHNQILENDKLLKQNKNNFYFIENNKYQNVNSKKVREHILNSQDISVDVPNKVIDYIKKHKLYEL